jgi:hypothetical protein
VNARSLLQVLHHGSFTTTSDTCRWLSPSTRTPLGRASSSPDRRCKELQVTYGSSPLIMSYILNMLIYVGMILLDNLLQYFLFISIIDLSRTCDCIATLICNALVMFMIYPWIKIKLKVLIFLSIQKFYCSHYSFIAGFVDALRPTPLTGANFKRWQMRATLWLSAMNMWGAH